MEQPERDADELEDLLNQLDGDETYVEAQIETAALQSQPSSSDEPVSNAIVPPEPTDIRRLDEPTTANTAAETPQVPVLDVAKIHDRLHTVTEEVLQACRHDRQEAQDTINMLKKEIDDHKTNKQNVDIPRIYIEGLVQAIEVKSGINQTAVKMMEVNAKMIAAARAGTNVNILNNNNSNDPKLTEILEQPLTAEDEY